MVEQVSDFRKQTCFTWMCGKPVSQAEKLGCHYQALNGAPFCGNTIVSVYLIIDTCLVRTLTD